MSVTNDFLPFCPTDTGTNLETQSDYIADTQRTDGNQPGIASSKLNNKALRQATYITSQMAQLLANTTSTDVLDDATPAKLLAQFVATLTPFAPNITTLTSGSGTWDTTYIFQIASGNATVGATYTNNSVTYTVVETIAAGATLRASGSGAPTTSGTLTKASGTGDATITFYAVRAPLFLKIKMVGGGGGGGGSGVNSGAGGTGGSGGVTTFGSSLLTANGGGGGRGGNGTNAVGGTASIGSGASGITIQGGSGQSAPANTTNTIAFQQGGQGGASALGGDGGGAVGGVGTAGSTNSGSGGGGGGGDSSTSSLAGSGGGAGGYIEAIIFEPSASYPFSIGSAGSAGTAGTSGFIGGAGGSGVIIVEEHYQ